MGETQTPNMLGRLSLTLIVLVAGAALDDVNHDQDINGVVPEEAIESSFVEADPEEGIESSFVADKLDCSEAAMLKYTTAMDMKSHEACQKIADAAQAKAKQAEMDKTTASANALM